MIVSKEEYESWRETMDIMRNAKLMREIRKGIQSLKRAKKRYTLNRAPFLLIKFSWHAGCPPQSANGGS